MLVGLLVSLKETAQKLDAVGQSWVAALANYNFQLHYKTGSQM